MAISIVSLAFAAAALALTIRREIMDRPQLHVSAATGTASLTGFGGIAITIENYGRRPVTIGLVGFHWHVRGDTPKDDGDVSINGPLDRTDLAPGQHHQVRWDAVPLAIPFDTPLRPYVEYSGRRAWGPLRPYLRYLEVGGWQPNQPVAADLRRPRDPPLVALPVEPRWKVWKAKELRREITPDVGPTPEEVAEQRAEAESAGGPWTTGAGSPP